MRIQEIETATKLVHDAVQARQDAEARQVAHGLIQGFIGPDHKVVDIKNFHSALVQALKAARMRGHDDCDVLTLT